MNITVNPPEGDSLTTYHVAKTTTQQLQDLLNGYNEGWVVTLIQFTGGRDWVVVAKYQWNSIEERDNALTL